MEPLEAIQATLELLHTQMKAAVRAEQFRDQLTGLRNDAALTEALTFAVVEGTPIWAAFVEIDKFKAVNDTFGYDAADSLLKSVADKLSECSTFFPHGMEAYRAHGDEFFLVGPMAPSNEFDVGEKLDVVRRVVGAICLKVDHVEAPMCCTVSIGWMTTQDAREAETNGAIDQRRVRTLLETAVNYAKREGRNRVERYSPSVAKLQVLSHRDQCKACKTSFSADIPHEGLSEGPPRCPNCGQACQPVVVPGGVPAIEEI